MASIISKLGKIFIGGKEIEAKSVAYESGQISDCKTGQLESYDEPPTDHEHVFIYDENTSSWSMGTEDGMRLAYGYVKSPFSGTTTTSTTGYPRTTTTRSPMDYSGAPVKHDEVLMPGETYSNSVVLYPKETKFNSVLVDIAVTVNRDGELDYVRVKHSGDLGTSSVSGSSFDRELIEDQMLRIANLQSAILQASEAIASGDIELATRILNGKEGACRDEACE